MDISTSHLGNEVSTEIPGATDQPRFFPDTKEA